MYELATQYQQYLKPIAAGLAGVCTLSVFLYGIFLLEAVIHTAARTTAEKQIRDIGSRLGSLEADYLAQNARMTPSRAEELGYVTPHSVVTVFATAQARSLSMRSGI